MLAILCTVKDGDDVDQVVLDIDAVDKDVRQAGHDPFESVGPTAGVTQMRKATKALSAN